MTNLRKPTQSISEDEQFLYVPESDYEEAFSYGAYFVEGDARFVKPRPLPKGIVPSVFQKWESDEAKYHWTLSYISSILGSMVDVEDFDDILQSVGLGEASSSRVYLFVPSFDVSRIRKIPGVLWDKKRKMYYATSQCDMNLIFLWLTPAAKNIWESERVLQKSLTLLVQERARLEAAIPLGSSPELGGGRAKHIKPPSRTIPGQ